MAFPAPEAKALICPATQRPMQPGFVETLEMLARRPAKNWLFIGHPSPGSRLANLFAVVESCRQLGHDPEAYLIELFTHLADRPAKRINEWLAAGEAAGDQHGRARVRVRSIPLSSNCRSAGRSETNGCPATGKSPFPVAWRTPRSRPRQSRTLLVNRVAGW